MASSSTIAAALFLAAAPAFPKEPTPVPEPAFDWSGTWAVFDAGADLVNLVVAPGGAIATTRVAPKATTTEVGKWEATEDALFIHYESGRGETILRHKSGFRHVSRTEDPENGERLTRVGAAFRLMSPVVPFVGAWRVDANGGGAILVLRSDGSADRISEPRTTGLWHVAAGGATIRWSDGAEETFDPSRATISHPPGFRPTP